PRPHPLHVPYTTLFRSPPSPIAPGELRLSSSMKVTLVGFDCCVYSGFRTFDSGASEWVGSGPSTMPVRSEEHTSELQSRFDLVCRLLREEIDQTIKVSECMNHSQRI